MAIEFAGFLHNSSGAAAASATVNLYDRNTTTPVRATTSTNASGYWAISHGTEGRFDVEITNGTTVIRIKYDDSFQVQTVETAALRLRNPANTFAYDIVPGAITAARTLNVPVITGTDTLAVLGLAQVFTAGPTWRSATAATAAGTVENTNDAASVLAAIFQGDRATPADNDLAYISLRLSDSAGNQDEQARIGWAATTVLNGATQDGDLILSALVNNTLTEMLRLDGSAASINFPSGTILDFAAGDVTLTHAANALTFADGDFFVADGNGVVIGHTAQATIAGGAPEFQVLGAGYDAPMAIGRFVASGAGPQVYAVKSRNTAIGSFTIVQDNDAVFRLIGIADDGVDYGTEVAGIDFEIDDATPAASDIGGAVVAKTAPGGGNVDGIREVWRWSAAGNSLALGGSVIQSAGATEIAFCVTNETLTVGNEGSVVVPYLSQTGAAFTDTIGGNLNGAIGVNYDSDTGPTTTIEVRAEGSWLSVAVTGYSINRHIPLAGGALNRDVAWWHDSHINGNPLQ